MNSYYTGIAEVHVYWKLAVHADVCIFQCPIHQMRVYHNTSAGGQLDIVMLSWSHVSLNKLIVKGHSIVPTPSLFSYNLLQEDYS